MEKIISKTIFHRQTIHRLVHLQIQFRFKFRWEWKRPYRLRFLILLKVPEKRPEIHAIVKTTLYITFYRRPGCRSCEGWIPVNSEFSTQIILTPQWSKISFENHSERYWYRLRTPDFSNFKLLRGRIRRWEVLVSLEGIRNKYLKINILAWSFRG